MTKINHAVDRRRFRHTDYCGDLSIRLEAAVQLLGAPRPIDWLRAGWAMTIGRHEIFLYTVGEEKQVRVKGKTSITRVRTWFAKRLDPKEWAVLVDRNDDGKPDFISDPVSLLQAVEMQALMGGEIVKNDDLAEGWRHKLA